MDSVASQPSSEGAANKLSQSKPSVAKSVVSEQTILAHLVLQRIPQFGPATYWAAQEALGNAENILAADPQSCRGLMRPETLSTLSAIQRQGDQHSMVEQAQRDRDWLGHNNVTIIVHDDERYPSLLKTIDQAPPVLFVRGELNNLFLPQLAIVGSRNPSPGGRENALRFAQQLSAMGFVITSGMALGVDAAAHLGALKNAGPTIAVMGTGIDKIYPHRHRRLSEELVQHGGAIVTEFPLGVGPKANHFPRRNRIISGMSLGVLVVEAAIKSGSLITARYALQQNREVFAVPGSIHNPLSRGCHALLREGATLVESIDDMAESLTGLLAYKWREIFPSLGDQQQTIASSNRSVDQALNNQEHFVLEQLAFDTTTLDVLEQRTGLSPALLLSTLMSLELKERVALSPGGYQRLPD